MGRHLSDGGVVRMRIGIGSVRLLAGDLSAGERSWHWLERRLVAICLGTSTVEQRKSGESANEHLGRMDTRADQAELNIYAELTK